jgi:hypothetical protein
MGHEIHINGFIEGISEDSFELIEEDLFDVFNEVYWKDNTVKIQSYGNYSGEILTPVLNKIAFCIDGGGSGQLDIEGKEHGDESAIFIIARQWKRVYIEIRCPENPFLKKDRRRLP